MHAKVALALSKRFSRDKDYPGLIRTYYTYSLPAFEMWLTVEDRLAPLDDETLERIQAVLEGDVENDFGIEQHIYAMMCSLDKLGVREYTEDCLQPHNIMRYGRELVLHDFGFTHSHLPTDFPVWT
jgi:hypothetical protein